jgi:hypothetical protein
MAVWPTLQANRMLRELKLIEFQLARRAAGQTNTPPQSGE